MIPKSAQPREIAVPGVVVPKTIVRRAVPRDIAAIVQLAKASLSAARWSVAAVTAYCTEGSPAAAAHAKAIFVASSTGRVAGLADASGQSEEVDAGEIVGFAAFSAITGAARGECALDNMVVAEEWHRRGIGSRLLAAGELWCRAQFAASLWLKVRASNSGALALYERAGFTATGRRPGYYTQPTEDAILMRKHWKLSSCL